MTNSNIPAKRGNESGQTLILGVIAIIIILLAALFLFDLQFMIRAKVKTQTAADAAALAGAKAQADSLNLIGEINMLKACTVLVSDFASDNTPERMEEASANLTQMQERIAFVGPLMGVGSAQLAAKNNGMMEYKRATKDFNSYLALVSDDDVYGTDDFPQKIEGYTWRTPYINMLDTLVKQKIAAAPTMHLPPVEPSYYMDSLLYDAILTKYWCYDTLRNLIKSDSNFTGKWWQGLVESVSFIEESELLSLHVKYSGLESTFDDARPFLTSLAAERGLTVSDKYNKDEKEDTDSIDSPLPYMRWCEYDAYWEKNVPGDHWVEGSSQLYLRRGLRPEYQYAGPVSLMECKAKDLKWMSGEYNWSNVEKNANDIQNGGTGIKATSKQTPEVVASATAKPLGSLGSGSDTHSPVEATMILPVFSKARLTPVMMPPGNTTTALGSDRFQIYKFLKWLDTVDDLATASSPPSGTERYLLAFQLLNDPLWRHEGYNPTYNYPGSGEVVEYDSDSDTGAGYLQQPTADPNGAPNGMPNDGYDYKPEYDGDGVLTGYSDEIIGIRYTKENRCDYHPPGTGPGHGGGGPGQLH